jgi:hypothetical protein
MHTYKIKIDIRIHKNDNVISNDIDSPYDANILCNVGSGSKKNKSQDGYRTRIALSVLVFG